VTIRVPAHGYSGLPCYAVVPWVPAVAEVRPKPRRLVGWKEILEVSIAHGGPTSSSWLRQLCKERNAPVKVWRGMAAVADEDRFVWWLEGLRVPIGLTRAGREPGADARGQAERERRQGRARAKRKGGAAQKGA